ncbi:putative aldolase class 2 protein RP493 [Oratosquilla oratoria]|uniref:putative aldolase class 2 protein RP493 n=1 Tax=Oratosquilla oratoria TaxID=337810 RepID=UPI003F75FB3C
MTGRILQTALKKALQRGAPLQTRAIVPRVAQAGTETLGGPRPSAAAVRTFTSAGPKPYTVPDSAWGRNRAARLELAAAYRGLDALGLNEGVCNHLSVMAPAADGSDQEVMLVFEYGHHFSEVTASSLLAVDADAKTVEGQGRPDITAACIHLGIRRVRPDAKVIFHTHQPYATTLACLKDPELKMVHQNSTRFYNRVAYDNNYAGLAHAMDEGERLGQQLGSKDIMFMGNHGVISTASTIAMAFDHLYYLERAAELQILAFSTQKEIALLSAEASAATEKQLWDSLTMYADAHYYSMYRRLRKTQPDFEL